MDSNAPRANPARGIPRALPKRWLIGLCIALHAVSASAEGAVIGAAASLREPVEWLVEALRARDPEAEHALVFGASSTLAAQIRLGAPIDVFLSANRTLVEELVAQGHLDRASVFAFARNQLVIIAPLDGVAPFSEPRALLADAVHRIALPAGAVPLGAYARAWLAAQGLEADALARSVATEHARATLAAVAGGNADVGIVYASDARTSDRVRVVYAVPEAETPGIEYVAARAKRASHPALADAVLEEVRAPGFAAALQRAHFLVGSDAPSGTRDE